MIRNQSNYSEFSNTYSNVIFKWKWLCLSKKTCLSAVLLLTMVLTLDSSWSLFYIGPLWPTMYWKNTTACLQHKPQTGCHKTTWKVLTNGDFREWQKLLNLIRNLGKWLSIWFDSKWKKHTLHSTIIDLSPQFLAIIFLKIYLYITW